jgi:molybdopterin molybdotransferase
MISVTRAREEIQRRTLPLPQESVPLDSAHGRVLREPVAAAEDMPPFDRSAMDGYAVGVNDPAREWELIGEIRAGESAALTIDDGQAARIFTGAVVPGAGLKVIRQEDMEAAGNRVRLIREGKDSHVRRRGEDARAGEVLLQPGLRLEAAALALLASVGKTSVAVSRAPRVLHLTTGDEIIDPSQTPAPGQIRNSNATLIGALCREWGAGSVTHFHAPDRLENMIRLLNGAEARACDLLLISGGSGAGKYDFTAELFRHLEAEIHFRQVDVRPGKPLIFGSSARQLVFGLPGNALSHFVCFHLFVRGALSRFIAGQDQLSATALLAKALEEASNDRETWWPARTARRGETVEICPLPWKSSGDITRLPDADALMRVTAGTTQLSAGAVVDYLSTRRNLSP